MHIIGVCGRKGGSGKTSVSVHLAAEFATRGRAVALVDCDVQGSATHWAEPGNLPMPVHHFPIEGDDQVGEWSAFVRELQADVVVLDSPPHLNAALGAVIGVCHLAVVPCGPSGLDLIATAETVGLIREIREAKGDGLPSIMLVPNRTDHRTAAGRELKDALADLGEPVAPEVRYRTAISDAFNAGAWVGVFAPNTPAHREMVALADAVLSILEGKTP